MFTCAGRRLTPLSKAGSCEVVDTQHVGRLFQRCFQNRDNVKQRIAKKKESSETGMNIGFGRKDVVKQQKHINLNPQHLQTS